MLWREAGKITLDLFKNSDPKASSSPRLWTLLAQVPLWCVVSPVPCQGLHTGLAYGLTNIDVMDDADNESL